MHEEAPPGQRGSHEPLMVALAPRAKLLTFSGALVALFFAALDQTIVATAAPRLVADLSGFDRFAWVFTAYLLGSTIGLPIAGKLSDLYGRKWVLMGGIVIFMTGSVLAGSAQTMDQLIVYRAIQGIGAAGIFGNVFTVLADLFWPAERGKWQGYLGTAFVAASVIGPLAGGTITDNWNWRWIFYINIPVGVLALSLIMFSMPAVRSLESRRAGVKSASRVGAYG